MVIVLTNNDSKKPARAGITLSEKKVCPFGYPLNKFMKVLDFTLYPNGQIDCMIVQWPEAYHGPKVKVEYTRSLIAYCYYPLRG